SGMARWGLAALTALCVATTAIAARQQPTGEIAGRVSFARDAAGIPGVRVTIQADGQTTSTTVTTGADGRFSAAKLAPGTYYVSFYLRGYRYLTRAGVTVANGSRAQVDVTLEKESPDA